jgi:hypothetical protein
VIGEAEITDAIERWSAATGVTPDDLEDWCRASNIHPQELVKVFADMADTLAPRVIEQMFEEGLGAVHTQAGLWGFMIGWTTAIMHSGIDSQVAEVAEGPKRKRKRRRRE